MHSSLVADAWLAWHSMPVREESKQRGQTRLDEGSVCQLELNRSELAKPPILRSSGPSGMRCVQRSMIWFLQMAHVSTRMSVQRRRQGKWRWSGQLEASAEVGDRPPRVGFGRSMRAGR